MEKLRKMKKGEIIKLYDLYSKDGDENGACDAYYSIGKRVGYMDGSFYRPLNTKEAEKPLHNSAIVQLLCDCQDVICNSVFLDDKGHGALMDRINAVVAQLNQ